MALLGIGLAVATGFGVYHGKPWAISLALSTIGAGLAILDFVTLKPRSKGGKLTVLGYAFRTSWVLVFAAACLFYLAALTPLDDLVFAWVVSNLAKLVASFGHTTRIWIGISTGLTTGILAAAGFWKLTS